MSYGYVVLLAFLLLCGPNFKALLFPTVNAEPLTMGVAVGGALATTGFLAGLNWARCKFYECCTDRWIVNNVTGIGNILNEKLYGQHLVIDTVVRAIRSHVSNPNPKKALVISFHGWAGGGKNYVSRFIAEHLYREGLRSAFVHYFVASRHFPHKSLTEHYRNEVQKWIIGNVTSCARSLFVFDELDKMAIGVMDAIYPFLDYHEQLSGIDYRKSIFIFLSNTGGEDITQRTLQYWRKGKPRENIALPEMEGIIQAAAFNEEGGLRFSKLITGHLIDHFVPFLPLEKSHIHKCIVDYWFQVTGSKPPKERIIQIADALQYYPKDYPLYSISGCKKVDKKVDLFLYDDDKWTSGGRSEL